MFGKCRVILDEKLPSENGKQLLGASDCSSVVTTGQRFHDSLEMIGQWHRPKQ